MGSRSFIFYLFGIAMPSSSHDRTTLGSRFVALLLTMGLLGGCGGGQYAPVSPEEIPELERRLLERPSDGPLLLRYSAALYAAELCDSAVTAAQQGMRIVPNRALGPLVLGQCFEREGDYQQALAIYRQYLEQYPEERGAPAVRARELIAHRQMVVQNARQALARESDLAQQPNPNTVAVLPITIISPDSSLEPLSRGLAQIITSDLDLIQQFQLVERLQVGALMDELNFNQGARVNQSTAARMGRLLQAGRLVQGLANVPPDQQVTLEATVVAADGEASATQEVSGSFRDLLDLEKELVVNIAAQLGYTLSEAELQLVLENGTQNLTAFLAYSRGLAAEDVGDYSAAAQFYGQAVQADPGFQPARQKRQATAAAPAVQQASASEVTTVSGQTAEDPLTAGAEPVSDAVNATVGDLAATQAEQTASNTVQQTTQQATNTTQGNPPPQSTPPSTLTGTIRIVFRLP